MIRPLPRYIFQRLEFYGLWWTHKKRTSTQILSWDFLHIGKKYSYKRLNPWHKPEKCEALIFIIWSPVPILFFFQVDPIPTPPWVPIWRPLAWWPHRRLSRSAQSSTIIPTFINLYPDRLLWPQVERKVPTLPPRVQRVVWLLFLRAKAALLPKSAHLQWKKPKSPNWLKLTIWSIWILR